MLKAGGWDAGRIWLYLFLTTVLAGCLDDDDRSPLVSDLGSASSIANGTSGSSDSDSSGNSPPRILGTPATKTTVGQSYVFEPSGSDADGDRLAYSIRNKPRWASFDPISGRLSGVPTESDLGLVTGIVISVSDSKMGAALPPFSISVEEESAVAAPPAGLAPPELSGTPSSIAIVEELYVFQPTASDPDGDQLEFVIMNKPSWLSFDPASGTLSGWPRSSDVGRYSDIVISATDGLAFRSLGPFEIEVVSNGSHSVMLSWDPPLENEDGSTLMDLAGYHIWYGDEPENYSNLINLNNPGVTMYGIDGLTPATYYFAITAYNSSGVESDYSNEAAITLF